MREYAELKVRTIFGESIVKGYITKITKDSVCITLNSGKQLSIEKNRTNIDELNIEGDL